MRKKIVRLRFILPAAILIGGAFFFLSAKKSKGTEAPRYVASKIVRGSIEETVSSNGSLKAVGTVDVLTQVTGTLERVRVDFNDRVARNQPLAEINTDKLKITLTQAEAALSKARAQFEYDRGEYDTSRSLRERSLISDAELASAKLAFETSKASLTQAQASYDAARMDIEQYAVVLSPIDGIVLDRSVDPGQTVVAGNTNTRLFTLAESLKTMDIEAAVDELDISKVALGQRVRFTVEAYSDRNFEGAVRQIRVVPTSSSNVVSYTVVVRADNDDGALLPGMTATLEFIISEKKDVVLVPSSALRFSPSEEVQAAARLKAFEERIADLPADQQAELRRQFEARSKAGSAAAGSSLLGGMGAPMGAPMGGPPPGAGGPPGGGFGAQGSSSRQAAAVENRKTLWLLEADGSLSMRTVAAGSSDGSNTELLNADDILGRDVVVRAN